jgi:hypothetical protein
MIDLRHHTNFAPLHRGVQEHGFGGGYEATAREFHGMSGGIDRFDLRESLDHIRKYSRMTLGGRILPRIWDLTPEHERTFSASRGTMVNVGDFIGGYHQFGFNLENTWSGLV